MTFGNWNEQIHEDPEQVKRLQKAQKADTTPDSIDLELQTGIFKGSGKKPYVATLDSCTCGDFIRRQVPCKHMYRLAMELSLINGTFEHGRNKNSLCDDVFALPPKAQELFYNMCVDNIYHGKTSFLCVRDVNSEELLTSGFCAESVPDITYFDTLTVKEIKSILFFDGKLQATPKTSAQKKTFVKWINENPQSALSALCTNFIILEFTSQTDESKHTIHRNFTKKFIHEEVQYDETGEITFDRVTPVFTQVPKN